MKIPNNNKIAIHRRQDLLERYIQRLNINEKKEKKACQQGVLRDKLPSDRIEGVLKSTHILVFAFLHLSISTFRPPSHAQTFR